MMRKLAIYVGIRPFFKNVLFKMFFFFSCVLRIIRPTVFFWGVSAHGTEQNQTITKVNPEVIQDQDTEAVSVNEFN